MTVGGAGSRRNSARRRRTFVIIALSMLAHGAILSIVGFNAPKLLFRNSPAEPVVNLWLTPDLARRSPSRLHEVAPKAGVASASVRPAEARARPQAPVPTLPSPMHSAPAAPATAPTGSAPANVGDVGAGVRAALRSRVGCDYVQTANLRPDERDRCSQHAAETAKLGPRYIDVIPPEKRAYYDAVQAAYQASHDPAHPGYRDANGDVQPWGKGPGVGCGMKFGGPPQPPDHRSWIDKVKATGLLGADLGPFRCGVVIPQGSMTPEIGIPTP